jgi:hypothetical protein
LFIKEIASDWAIAGTIGSSFFVFIEASFVIYSDAKYLTMYCAPSAESRNASAAMAQRYQVEQGVLLQGRNARSGGYFAYMRRDGNA